MPTQQRATSNPLVPRLGFWSAAAALLTFVTFTVCFTAIALTSPLFVWTNLDDYVAYVREYGGVFQPLAQFAMLVFGLCLVVLLNCIHECTSPERRILTRTGISFGLLFAATTGVHYFAQISVVRLSLLKGQVEGLQYLAQANPYSALSAVNMLGWTVFLGLASLFVAPVFSAGRLGRLIRLAFLLNGIFCLSGGVGYVWEIRWLVFVAITLGMGGAVMVATAALALWFRRAAAQPAQAA